MNKKYVFDFLVIFITFFVLLINFSWGLPNNKRLELVGGKNSVGNNLSGVIRAGNKNALLDTFTYKETIHRAVFRSLLASWAGDDNIAIRAISNLNPYTLKFDPQQYIYGGGFIYTGAVFIQLASWLNLVNAIPNKEYYLMNPEEFGKIYTVLRFMVVLFATLGIYMVFYITKEKFDYTIALLSWGIILVIPETQASARVIEPHLYVLPFFILSFYYILKSTEEDTRKNYILSAIFSGITIGTQSLGFYIIFAFFASLIINYKKQLINLRTTAKYFIMYAFVSTCVVLLLNPFYIINYRGFLENFYYGSGNVIFKSLKIWAHYQISWFLLILFICAILFHLFRYKKNIFSVISLACIIPAIFVYLGTNNIMQYIYSSLPLMAVLAAVMLRDIYSSIYGAKIIFYIVATVILFIISPLGHSVYYIFNFNVENRESAGEWINDNIPAESTIAMRYPPTLWDGVPFKFYDYKVVDYTKINKKQILPDAVILSNADLPESIKIHYDLVKEYLPESILGFRYVLKGEIHALIAKTIKIYRLRS